MKCHRKNVVAICSKSSLLFFTYKKNSLLFQTKEQNGLLATSLHLNYPRPPLLLLEGRNEQYMDGNTVTLCF